MEGYCSLIIRGDVLKFDEIEKNLGMKASKKYHKGKTISKFVGENKFDLIRFDESIMEDQSIDDTLEFLLNKIVPYERYIKYMQRHYDIVLKCFVQSSNAQVRFNISPNNIAKINQLGLKLEISILSWGGADKE